jgi:hypothetical protein
MHCDCLGRGWSLHLGCLATPLPPCLLILFHPSGLSQGNTTSRKPSASSRSGPRVSLGLLVVPWVAFLPA